MNWIKRGTEKTIEEVIMSYHEGVSTKDFLNDTKIYHINQLTEAAQMILEAVKNKEHITVVGDYDCDGVTSSSIMTLLLKELKANFSVRLPRRISEGYGLSEKIIDEISSGLIITVDNGIAALEPIKKAKEKGLKVLVTDHHLPIEPGLYPEADLIIDPNAIPNSADYPSYCGAGLAYKLAIEVLGKEHKLIPTLLSFAAIGTVADVMPLTGENRRIVKQGLKTMKTYKGSTSGLRALIEVAQLEVISSIDIGFKIGPMLNAPGRLRDNGAEESMAVLVFDGKAKDAIRLAEGLQETNENRKAIKEDYIKRIENNMSANCLYGDQPLVIYEPDLMEGMVGILAGYFAEREKSPCIVFTNTEEGLLKGSARSYGNIHLKNMLDEVAEDIYRYGGHAGAAGITIEANKLETFRYHLMEVMPEIDDEGMDTLYYDLEINESEIDQVIKELEQFAPFGEGNPEPTFVIKEFILCPRTYGYYSKMGANEQHLKMLGRKMNVVGFDMAKRYEQDGTPKSVSVIGQVSKNYFMGRSYNQMLIQDYKKNEIEKKRTPMAERLAKKAAARYSS